MLKRSVIVVMIIIIGADISVLDPVHSPEGAGG